MKKFTLRLLLFCLAPLPLLYFLQHVIDTGLKRSRNFFYAEWSDLYHGKINADLIVCGTSRAWVQISPRILDSSLNINSYNLGMDATPFYLQFERLKLYLRYNRKPKYILQEVGYTSTLVRTKELPHPQQYLPYLSDTTIWRVTQNTDEPFSQEDRYFPLYKYNNELPVVKEGIMSYLGRGVKSEKYKGYMGMEKVWDSSFYQFRQANPKGKVFPVDPQAVALFREFLDYCKTNDIKVFMVYPPAFIESLYATINREEIEQVYKRFSAEYNVPFLNYMYDSLNYSRSNFYNSLHLNKRGSEIFSAKLATDLRPYMTK